MRLLLVEDEDAIRIPMLRALHKWGYEAEGAGSLAESWEVAERHGPEGLLSDLKLPDGNGLDIALHLGVPFVLMSGYASFDDAVVALRHNCVDFLTKPVTMKDLRHSLSRLQERQHGGEIELVTGASRLGWVTRTSSGIREQMLQVHEWRWDDPARAAGVFSELCACSTCLRQRQVAAELIQAAGNGRLVLNLLPSVWRMWLEAQVFWDTADNKDRHAFLEAECDRVDWRREGVLVECCHG